MRISLTYLLSPTSTSQVPVRVVRVALRVVKVEVGKDDLNSFSRSRYERVSTDVIDRVNV